MLLSNNVYNEGQRCYVKLIQMFVSILVIHSEDSTRGFYIYVIEGTYTCSKPVEL